MSRGRTAGNKGQGSKWISKKTRHRIYARDGWRCVWCGEGVRLGTGAGGAVAAPIATLDHVIPRTHGGANQPSNLVTSCMQCNRERGDRGALLWVTHNRVGVYGEAHYALRLLDHVLSAVCKPLPLLP